jgi:MFS family permease
MRDSGGARNRRDLTLLIAARMLRAYAFGFSIVLFGLHLERRGLSASMIGLVLASGLLGSAISSLLAAYVSKRIGRRLTLALIGILMALAGVDLAFATSPWLLVLAGLTGMYGAGWVDLGPFLAIEQAMLTEAVTPSSRNRAFARYSLIGTVALGMGGFTASWGTTLARSEAFYVAFAVIGLVTAVLPLLLSSTVEAELNVPVFGALRPLIGLTLLLMLDSFAGSFAFPSLIAYWLHVRFGATAQVLGPTFTVIPLLQAASYEVAGRLADRIGLINTMVGTHLPAVLLLMLLPFTPSLFWAIGLLFLFSCLSEMDVPARQAYLVSIVKPGQRAGAVAMTGAARAFAQIFGPAIAGWAIQVAAFGLPFYILGVGKILFLGGLYAGFRRVKGEHEVANSVKEVSM